MNIQDKKILLVDDDAPLREALSEQLKLLESLQTDEADNGSAALEKIKKNHYDLILLDVGLPDMDGREICRLARREGIKTPIIMLTGADSDSDTILGLEAGANDYIAKPFRMGVLLARVRAQLRQFEQSEDAVLRIGPYRFKPGSKKLEDEQGDIIRLTEKETNILRFLYHAGGKSVSREDLLTDVWGYNKSVTTHTLETHIYRLRQKIETDPAEAEILLTEPGGYRLNIDRA